MKRLSFFPIHTHFHQLFFFSNAWLAQGPEHPTVNRGVTGSTPVPSVAILPERSKGVDSSSTMFACAGSNPADGTLVVGVINTLRARGHWFDSFIGDAPLISTVEVALANMQRCWYPIQHHQPPKRGKTIFFATLPELV